MATLKTQRTDASVKAFLAGIDDEQRRQECETVLALMQEETGEPPAMWGDSIVGFGSYHYRYASGREGDWFLTGFASRKRALTVYIMAGFDRYDDLLQQLGPHKTGSSCLYLKRLSDIDLEVLRDLVRLSAEHVARQHAEG